MKVLALDLSLTSTGYASDNIVGRLRPACTGVERLDWMRSAVRSLVFPALDERADLVAIEGYSFGTARQASHAHGLGELGGVIRLALHTWKVPYVEIPPASLKKYATGKGNASKEEVLVAAVKRLGYDGSSNDEADALWLRAMTLDVYGLPVAEVPLAHRDGIAKVSWPDIDLTAVA